MRIAIAFLLLSLARPCFAAFTDFSDYTQAHSFAPGEAFESNGLNFQAVSFRSNPNPVRVFGAVLAGPGVEFLVSTNVQQISLDYHDGAASAFAINGIQSQYAGNGAGFSHYDGVTFAGVSVETTVLSQDSFLHNGRPFIVSETGRLTLRGEIHSFVIAGLELSIDNVFVQVPEPSCGALLSAFGLLTIAARARRKA